MIRPNVHFTCDVRYDPFVMMEDENKVYGRYRAVSPINAKFTRIYGVKGLLLRYMNGRRLW